MNQSVTPPPVPTRQPMIDTTGLATRPWIAWFTNILEQVGYYQTVQSSGTAVAQEGNLNFLPPLTATDNPVDDSTDIGIDLPTPPAEIVRVDTANGSYIELSDGTLIQWGTAPSVAGGGVASPHTFPKAFTVSSVVVSNILAGAGNVVSSIVSKTLAAFTYRVDGLVFVGGSGSTPTGSETVEWIAMGS